RRRSGHFPRLGQDWRDSSHRDSGGAAVDLRQFTSATKSLDGTNIRKELGREGVQIMKSKQDHRFGTFSIVLILTGVLICLAALRFSPARAGSSPRAESNRQPVAPADSERFARSLYGTLPLTFEPNWDQPNKRNTLGPAAICFTFQQHSSPNMLDIGVGPSGTVWGAGADNNVYRLIGNTFQPVPA